MPDNFDETRRQLLAGSVGIATSLYAAHAIAATEAGAPTVDEGTAGRPPMTGMLDGKAFMRECWSIEAV